MNYVVTHLCEDMLREYGHKKKESKRIAQHSVKNSSESNFPPPKKNDDGGRRGSSSTTIRYDR